MAAGRKPESFALRTAGPVAGLRITPDRASLRADGQDLAFLTVEAVDRDGRWVPNCALPVIFAVGGPGSLAGAGSADLTSLQPYQAALHALFQGRALAVIRSGRAPGTIHVTATAATGSAPLRAAVDLGSSP